MRSGGRPEGLAPLINARADPSMVGGGGQGPRGIGP
jgi:hypothetical protein